MTESPIGSPDAGRRALPLVFDLPDDAWFDIGLMHKDIRLGAGDGRPTAESRCRRLMPLTRC